MEIENDEEYIIVDLGELSRTRFGASIKDAEILETPEGCRVHIQSEAVSAVLNCVRTNPGGTYVIYSSDGTVLGKTREVFQNSREV
jgi:hypothetical protein